MSEWFEINELYLQRYGKEKQANSNHGTPTHIVKKKRNISKNLSIQQTMDVGSTPEVVMSSIISGN